MHTAEATTIAHPVVKDPDRRLEQVYVALDALRLPGYAALSARMRDAAQNVVADYLEGK